MREFLFNTLGYCLLGVFVLLPYFRALLTDNGPTWCYIIEQQTQKHAASEPLNKLFFVSSIFTLLFGLALAQYGREGNQ